MQPKVKKRYVIGRSNNRSGATINFHVNHYFGCVTASRFMNRETWVLEIEPLL